MSELSYLEMLSNKQLHAKCQELGLPNIPVTDSSRRVILRRLHSAISGIPLNKSKSAATATKKTPRRETIHNDKMTPAADISSSNDRAAAETSSRNNNNSRRTIAATPRKYYPLDNSAVRSIETTTTVSDVGSQSEDDDYFQNISPSYKAENQRQRRSVSLTKSGVVTTSYTREVQQHQPEYNEEVDLPQSYTYHRPQVPAPVHRLPVYKPHIERSYAPTFSQQRLTQTQLNSTSYSNDINDQPMRDAPLNAYSGSAAPFNSDAAFKYSSRQRNTIGNSGVARGRLLQPTYQVNTLYPQLNEFYDQPNNTPQPMDVDTDSEPEEEIQLQHRSHSSTVESPYVSQFSRQLDARQRSSPLARPQIRKNIQLQKADSPMHQFKELVRKLDQQYHIKFYFFLTLAVVFATFVYVVVTP